MNAAHAPNQFLLSQILHIYLHSNRVYSNEFYY